MSAFPTTRKDGAHHHKLVHTVDGQAVAEQVVVDAERRLGKGHPVDARILVHMLQEELALQVL